MNSNNPLVIDRELWEKYIRYVGNRAEVAEKSNEWIAGYIRGGEVALYDLVMLRRTGEKEISELLEDINTVAERLDADIKKAKENDVII